VVPGNQLLEAEFHYRLRDSSVRGEWFAEPGIDGFLEWMKGYAAKVKEHFETFDELPEPPLTRREALASGRREGANLIHRWRMSAPVKRPGTMRYVKPEPVVRTPEEMKELERQRIIEGEVARTRYTIEQ